MQRSRSAFAWVCYSMCVGVMGTALASPLYPLYQAAWKLRPSDITHIFVVYMFGALASLLFLGRTTARFGFLPILRAGLGLMTAGMALSAVAGNVPVFMLARLVIGLASGMITTSAAVGMMQWSPVADARRTTALTTVAMTLGFAMGPLLGGLIAQWLPHPLVTAYVPTLVMGAVAVWALLRLRDEAGAAQARPAGGGLAQWLPRITFPQRERRRHFWLASLGAFSAFGMFSLFASLAPIFMGEFVPWHGPAVSGLTIASILFLSSIFQFSVRSWPTKQVVVVSGVALAGCNLLLVWTALSRTPLLFAASVVATAYAHGLANVGGMSVIGKLTRPSERAGLLSSYLIVGYLGSIVPILAMGWLSDRVGLNRALVVFSCAMAGVSAVVAGLAVRTREIGGSGPSKGRALVRARLPRLASSRGRHLAKCAPIWRTCVACCERPTSSCEPAPGMRR